VREIYKRLDTLKKGLIKVEKRKLIKGENDKIKEALLILHECGFITLLTLFGMLERVEERYKEEVGTETDESKD
jgi:hypothetical protein